MARRRAIEHDVDFPTSIRLPRDIKKLLQQEAAKRRTNLSWMVVEILRSWQAYIKAQDNAKIK